MLSIKGVFLDRPGENCHVTWFDGYSVEVMKSTQVQVLYIVALPDNHVLPLLSSWYSQFPFGHSKTQQSKLQSHCNWWKGVTALLFKWTELVKWTEPIVVIICLVIRDFAESSASGALDTLYLEVRFKGGQMTTQKQWHNSSSSVEWKPGTPLFPPPENLCGSSLVFPGLIRLRCITGDVKV